MGLGRALLPDVLANELMICPPLECIMMIINMVSHTARVMQQQSVTLVGLYVHAGSGTVAAHWLALAHVHLALAAHALGGGNGVVVGAHGAVAAGRDVHGAAWHVGRLVRPWALHGHMVRSWRDNTPC